MSAHVWIYLQDIAVVAADSRVTLYGADDKQMMPLDGVSKMRFYDRGVLTFSSTDTGNGSEAYVSWITSLRLKGTMEEMIGRIYKEGRRKGFEGFCAFLCEPGKWGRVRYVPAKGTDEAVVQRVEPSGIFGLGVGKILEYLTPPGAIDIEKLDVAQIINLAAFFIQTAARYRVFCGEGNYIGGPIDLAFIKHGEAPKHWRIGEAYGINQESLK